MRTPICKLVLISLNVVLGTTLVAAAMTTMQLAHKQSEFIADDLTTKQVALKQYATLHVKLNSELSSRTSKLGDVVVFQVLTPYLLDRFTAVDRGTLIKARIRAVQQSGHRGRPGSVKLEFLGATAVDGTIVPVHFNSNICCTGAAANTLLLDPGAGSVGQGSFEEDPLAPVILPVDAVLVPFYLLKKGGDFAASAGYQFELVVSQDTVVQAKFVAANALNEEFIDAIFIHGGYKDQDKDRALSLLQEGADLNSVQWYGYSVLAKAADLKGWNFLAKIALSQKIDLESRLPAMCAAAARDNVELVQLIVDSGVDINTQIPGLYSTDYLASKWIIQSPTSQSALMCAARGGAPQATQFLLERGADPTTRFGQGETALQIAQKKLKAEEKYLHRARPEFREDYRHQIETQQKIIALLEQAEAQHPKLRNH